MCKYIVVNTCFISEVAAAIAATAAATTASTTTTMLLHCVSKKTS